MPTYPSTRVHIGYTGSVIAEGTPERVARVEKSYTGQYLRPILVGHEALQPSEVIEALAKKS